MTTQPHGGQDAPPERGMPIGIVRSPDGDYSLGGISAGRSRLTLIGAGVPPLFEPTPSAPAVLLASDEAGRPIISETPGGAGFEHGGAFGVLADQIAHVVPYYGAIPIHDRRV